MIRVGTPFLTALQKSRNKPFEFVGFDRRIRIAQPVVEPVDRFEGFGSGVIRAVAPEQPVEGLAVVPDVSLFLQLPQ
jgi:hypothetical protein